MNTKTKMVLGGLGGLGVLSAIAGIVASRARKNRGVGYLGEGEEDEDSGPEIEDEDNPELILEDEGIDFDVEEKTAEPGSCLSAYKCSKGCFKKGKWMVGCLEDCRGSVQPENESEYENLDTCIGMKCEKIKDRNAFEECVEESCQKELANCSGSRHYKGGDDPRFWITTTRKKAGSQFAIRPYKKNEKNIDNLAYWFKIKCNRGAMVVSNTRHDGSLWRLYEVEFGPGDNEYRVVDGEFNGRKGSIQRINDYLRIIDTKLEKFRCDNEGEIKESKAQSDWLDYKEAAKIIELMSKNPDMDLNEAIKIVKQETLIRLFVQHSKEEAGEQEKKYGAAHGRMTEADEYLYEMQSKREAPTGRTVAGRSQKAVELKPEWIDPILAKRTKEAFIDRLFSIGLNTYNVSSAERRKVYDYFVSLTPKERLKAGELVRKLGKTGMFLSKMSGKERVKILRSNVVLDHGQRKAEAEKEARRAVQEKKEEQSADLKARRKEAGRGEWIIEPKESFFGVEE